MSQNIVKAKEMGLIELDPFSDKQLSATGYELRLGKILSEPKKRSFNLKTGMSQTVESMERVRFSNQIFGRFGVIEANLGSRLHIHCNLHLDPGYQGNVCFLIENRSQGDVLIETGMPLASLEVCFLHKSKVLPKSVC